MKLQVLALGTVAALALAGSTVTKQEDSAEQVVQQSHNLNTGGEVSIETANGLIRVLAADTSQVSFTATKGARANRVNLGCASVTIGDAEEDAAALLEEIEIDVDSSPERLAITTEFPSDSEGYNLYVAYDVIAPRGASLTLETSNGPVEIANIQGDITADTSNGKITVQNTAANLDLETNNGAIELVGVSGGIHAKTSNGEIGVIHAGPLEHDIDCETSNGRISLELPEASAFDLVADTSNGRIETDFTVDGERRPGHLEGAVNGGGSDVKLRTSNGAINVQRR